jgi:hypothetical protein
MTRERNENDLVGLIQNSKNKRVRIDSLSKRGFPKKNIDRALKSGVVQKAGLMLLLA